MTSQCFPYDLTLQPRLRGFPRSGNRPAVYGGFSGDCQTYSPVYGARGLIGSWATRRKRRA